MKKEKVTKLLVMRMIFALIAFGFTLISAWNGFNFYRVLFGLAIAVLISATFEIARFTCLFRYIHTGAKMSTLTIIFYVITASVCAFASINAFTAEVIKQNRVNEKEFQEQIYSIKQAYLKETATSLDALNKDIRYLENNAAKYPGSKYWKRRLSQVEVNRDEFLKDREQFLNQKPEDMEQWIRVESARFGVEIEETTEKSEEIIAVRQALEELWSLDKMTAQKIMGIIVTIVVEISILLLAILATKGKEPDHTEQIPDKKDDFLLRANTIFGEKLVYKFLAVCRRTFKRSGKLPAVNRLNKELRPVRLYFDEFDGNSLQELF